MGQNLVFLRRFSKNEEVISDPLMGCGHAPASVCSVAKMKILAIDYGKKRLGFALGNTALNTSAPLAQIERKNKAQVMAHIAGLIEEYDIEKILTGYPLHMDGRKSEIGSEVEAFAAAVEKKTGLPVELIDERLTSFEAEELLKTVQPDFKKRKKVLDSVSALVLLRSYMEDI